MSKTLEEIGNITGDFWASKLKVVEKKEELKSRISKYVVDFLTEHPDCTLKFNIDFQPYDRLRFGVYPYFPFIETMNDMGISKEDFDEEIEIDSANTYPIGEVVYWVNKFTIYISAPLVLCEEDSSIAKYIVISRCYCEYLINYFRQSLEYSKPFQKDPVLSKSISNLTSMIAHETMMLEHLVSIFPTLTEPDDPEEIARVERFYSE